MEHLPVVGSLQTTPGGTHIARTSARCVTHSESRLQRPMFWPSESFVQPCLATKLATLR